MTGTAIPDDLPFRLADMARDLVVERTVEETLGRISSHAVHIVEGCEAAGILVVRGGRPETLAGTDHVVVASDRMQYEVGEGPCIDAAGNKAQVYRIADMHAPQDRWPHYAPRARALGVGSMMGFLLYTEQEDDLGALNLYSSRPNAFTERSEQVGWLLASHAAVAFSTARTQAQLREAIGTRQTIGEAVGILMARYGLDESGAFDTLVKTSQSRNIKVRELAEAITTGGEL